MLFCLPVWTLHLKFKFFMLWEVRMEMIFILVGLGIFLYKNCCTRLIIGPVSVNPLVLGDFIFDFFFMFVVDYFIVGIFFLSLGLVLLKGSLNCFFTFLISSPMPLSLISVITLRFIYSFLR